MLNENIKNLRKQKGYTQETFAQELNVVRQTVSKWEKGYSVPDAAMLEKMAEVLEVSVSDLLGIDEEKVDNKTDLKQISEQLSILNNQFARELARKKRNKRIALIVSAIIFVIAVAVLIIPSTFMWFSYEDPEDGESTTYSYCEVDDKLDRAISDAIMAENRDRFLPGEFQTESHLVYSTEENDGKTKVYLYENYTEYGFKNGFFIPVSGSSLPAVYTFSEDGEEYKFINAEYPEDGGHYDSSIKRMFPKTVAKMILNGLSESEDSLMHAKQDHPAQKYLDSIGRGNTLICDLRDIYIDFLTDYGVSVDVENSLLDNYPDYDSTIGNHEKIENGKRYVYQTEYDNQNNLIIFTKFEYGTNNIVEFIAVDGATGKEIKNAKNPEKVTYKMGRLSRNIDKYNQATTKMVVVD